MRTLVREKARIRLRRSPRRVRTSVRDNSPTRFRPSPDRSQTYVQGEASFRLRRAVSGCRWAVTNSRSFGMRHRLYYHLVWGTLDRNPWIEASTATFLSRFLRWAAGHERARVLELGAVRTHVHLLVTAHPLTVIPRLVQRIKGSSALLINRDGLSPAAPAFRWTPGYNAETVTPRDIDRVRRYLRGQAQHHPLDAIEGWEGDHPAHEVLRE